MTLNCITDPIFTQFPFDFLNSCARVMSLFTIWSLCSHIIKQCKLKLIYHMYLFIQFIICLVCDMDGKICICASAEKLMMRCIDLKKVQVNICIAMQLSIKFASVEPID